MMSPEEMKLFLLEMDQKWRNKCQITKMVQAGHSDVTMMEHACQDKATRFYVLEGTGGSAGHTFFDCRCAVHPRKDSEMVNARETTYEEWDALHAVVRVMQS